MSRYRKKEEKKQLYKKIGIAAAVLIVGGGITAGVLGAADGKLLSHEQTETVSNDITYNGKAYTPKGNLETYLFAGIDSPGQVEELTEYDGTGQCDVLIVLVRDRSTDECQYVTIDRNTITPVDSLENNGNYISTDDIQISLAHAMSLDHTTRAENTVKAVSTLLGGATIDSYAMVNMSAIQVVNDMVGGVTVTIEDDFTGVDDTLKKGETITLKGEQAEHFVRGRMTMKDDDTNQNRMARQQQYEAGLKTAFAAKCAEDNTFPLDVYHALEPYMTTTVSAKKFSRLALLMTDEKEDTSLQIDGTYSIDDNDWQAFTPDPDSLQQVILTLFYEEKK